MKSETCKNQLFKSGKNALTEVKRDDAEDRKSSQDIYPLKVHLISSK